jgi:hypothetical protein
MSLKILKITMLLLILSSMCLFLNQVSSAATATTTDPISIKLYLGPNKIPADSGVYNCIAVQLLDSQGKPARAIAYTTISLSSSKTNIGEVDSYILIKPGDTYGTAKFYSTNTTGTTTISAAATDFATVQGTITTSTMGTVPTKLMAYCTPAFLPADNQKYAIFQLQLQDAQGHPAVLVKDLYVNLFSSNPEVATVAYSLWITAGKPQVTVNLSTTNTAGFSSITAQASNYTVGQAKITTNTIDLIALKAVVTANPANIPYGNKTVLTTFVSADGSPIVGATVKFSSDNGGTFTTVKDVGDGSYKANFTAPALSKITSCTIIASVSKNQYLSTQGKVQVNLSSTALPVINDAMLILQIKDYNGNPIKDVLATSTALPSGMLTIANVSDSEGYLLFQGLKSGSYTFKIEKSGFSPINQTLNITSKQLSLTLMLKADTSASNNTLIIIAIVVSASVIVTVWLLVKRMQKTSKLRKLHQLQKQLNQE